MSTTSRSDLWHHADFLRLWVGQSISQIGSQVSFLALPLVATLSLGATPFQMGLLTAVSSLPSLLVGLHAGALVDRHRRRPVLIASDIGRAALLGLVPLAWAMDMLSMELLYVVALLAGALSLFFDVAYQAFLPTIVDRDQLVDGNGKLELSRTAAEIAGPSLAGWLTYFVTAPFAIALDALSYLLSALSLSGIRASERIPLRSIGSRRIWSEIGEGLHVVVSDPRLRAVVGSRGLLSLFNAMLEAVVVLYIVHSLGLSPVLIGLIFSIGSVGFLVGALLPARVSDRVGVGPAMAGGIVLVGLSDLLMPLARGSLVVVVPLLVVAQFLFGLGLTLVNVNQASLRQAIIPNHLQGRAGATVRFLVAGLIPLGALLGGISGEVIGLRPTLVIAALGEILAGLWIWFSPLRTMRDLPASIEETPLATP